MARGLKLRRLKIENANHYHLRGFRIRVEVVEVSGGMDRDVFLYRRSPVDPFTGEATDEFQTVASFPDIADYPVGAPSETRPYPYFRQDFVELDVRSTRDYELVWELLVSEIGILINALDRAENLVVAEEVWLGTQPGDSVEPSEASQDSTGSQSSQVSSSSESV